MSLEHLWAGWRREYIVAATERERAGVPADDPADCVFCRLAASGEPSEDNLVVWRGEQVFVVMNAYPYASGHVLVMPLRHVGSLAALTGGESAELWAATQQAVATIEAAYDPDGLNVGGQSRPGRRRRAARTPPPARRAALVRRHQLHDVRGRDARAARDTGPLLEEAHRRLAPIGRRRMGPGLPPAPWGRARIRRGVGPSAPRARPRGCRPERAAGRCGRPGRRSAWSWASASWPSRCGCSPPRAPSSPDSAPSSRRSTGGGSCRR